MKIITRGDVPPKRIWEGSCGNCHSVMQENEGNLTVILKLGLDTNSAVARCPVCTHSFMMYGFTEDAYHAYQYRKGLQSVYAGS